MSNSNTLTIENLHCIRGDKSLFNDLDIKASSGQCVHITGENGCGKSSLLRIISGLNTPDEGRVLWNNSAIQNNQLYFNDSEFIGHKDGLKNELSAIENLRFNQHLSAQISVDEKILDDSLHQMQILQCADLLTQQLSFGQRRRLSFAKLLLRPYKIWLLDEPFTGIDKNGRDVIENICLTHLENGGIIILTHHQGLNKSKLSNFLVEFKLDQHKKIDSDPTGKPYE